MKVKFLDLKVYDVNLKKRLLNRLENILDHGIICSGPEEKEFERRFAETIGVKYAVGVSSGSSALYLALLSIGLGPGDEVITTPYTWIITTHAIASVGATPVFVDVMSDFNIDPEEIKKAITPKTKAIVPMHVAGHMCKMESISRIAKDNNLFIVEDAAQAYCSSQNGKRAGSFSHTGAFSMNPMKILHAYGEAGVVVTNRKHLYDKILQFRHAGTKRYLDKNKHINRSNFVGLNHKIDTIQASFLLEEMDRIGEIKSKRDLIANYYDENLLKIGCIPQPSSNGEHGRYYYMFLCDRRNELSKFLQKNNIENKIYYSPLASDSKIYKRRDKLKLPVARYLLKRSLTIPMHENMSMKQAEYVIKTIRYFYNNYSK